MYKALAPAALSLAALCLSPLSASAATVDAGNEVVARLGGITGPECPRTAWRQVSVSPGCPPLDQPSADDHPAAVTAGLPDESPVEQLED